MRAFLHDLRHTVRGLLRTPAFTIIAVLTLALGIGATSAIFSVINGVVLQPLPYVAPERLVMITSQFPTLGFDRFWVSPPEFVELREHSREFDEVGAYTVSAVNIGAGDSPSRVTAAAVTPSLFTVLGTPPARGRTFTEEEMRPNADPVVVLSDALWREAYGGDPGIVGQAIEVDGVWRTVVGVMPPSFDLRDERVRIWVPLTIDPEALPNQRGSHFLYLIGRLRPGATLAQADAELGNLLRTWREIAGTGHVPNDTTHRLQYADLREDVIGDARTSLWMLQGAVLFVLLVACANMANLLLARAEARQKEYAIRAALGAGRRRLLGLFFGEGLLLAVGGGVLGLLLAWGGVKALLAANPDSIPRAAEIGLDWRVLTFTAFVVLATSLVFAFAPLLHLGGEALSISLKEGAARTTATLARLRLRRALVVGEVALAVALVVGAGLMLRSFWNRLEVDAGFDRKGLTTFGVVLPAATYPDGAQRVRFFDELLASLRQTAGIQGVAAMAGLPPLRDVNANGTDFEGIPNDDPERPFNVDYYQFVTPDYVATMGIPVVDGRGFTESDVAGAPPVVLVNETLARRYWPGQSAVGRRMRPRFGPDTSWMTVVGVLKDVKQGGVDAETGTEMYFSYAQAPARLGNAPRTMNVVVRSTLPPDQVQRAARHAVASLDPALPLVNFRTMDAVFSDSVARPRFLAQLLAVFAAVALALSAVGTYGVLSYMVTERRREIGVRMALGADRGTVRRMVLGQGMRTALAGVALGVLAALALSRLVSSLLFGVSPADPATFLSVALFIAVVALAACAVPAWRATRVDPMVALRAE